VGLSLRRLGRWEEAGRIHWEAAAERECILGLDHPDTLVARYEVGISVSDLLNRAQTRGLQP
jgi:eukaryotic-like serine/threonine-protein kinase